MTKAGKSVALACIVLVAAVFLNPSAERHRTRIMDSVAERSPLAGLLGVEAFTAFASSYHSVGVASYTSINGRTVSVGLFGMVFVLDTQTDN